MNNPFPLWPLVFAGLVIEVTTRIPYEPGRSAGWTAHEHNRLEMNPVALADFLATLDLQQRLGLRIVYPSGQIRKRA